MKRIAGLALLLGLAAAPALGSGPTFDVAFLEYSKHPDIPFSDYTAGQLGVLQSTYARSYLFVAYRILKGGRFDDAQSAALDELWVGRLIPHFGGGSDDALARWKAARALIPGAGKEPPETPFKAGESHFVSFFNCNDDAFDNAIKTLKARFDTWGAARARAWLAAQDAVFANCSGAPTLPEPAPPGASRLQRADRDYQTAAALFYSGEYARAAAAFDEIARDGRSPWRPMGPYLAARAQIRFASLGKDSFDDAERRLRAILQDKAQSAFHARAGRLLGFVRFRAAPEERLRELGRALMAPKNADLKNDLTDYIWLLDEALDQSEVDLPKTSIDLDAQRRGDELTDWILTFQAVDEASLAHALERFRKTASLPWLVAAIAKIPPRHPRAPALLAAADAVPAASPPSVMLAFHQARLLAGGGELDAARARIDLVLGRRVLPESARNRLLAARMALARDLAELTTLLPRVPLAVGSDDGREIPEALFGAKPTTPPFAFDRLGGQILQARLPLSSLVELSRATALPDPLRAQLARASWVRAVMLGDNLAGAELAKLAGSLDARLTGATDAYLGDGSPEDRRFSGLLTILRFPGLRPYVDIGLPRRTALDQIDNFRDNWWCADGSLGIAAESETEAPPPPPELAFLDGARRQAAQAGRRRLVAHGPGPDALGDGVIQYLLQHPKDARAPEALHLVVRSTRFGCTDKRTSRVSKRAYELLHRNYPKSPWTTKTKFWF